MSRAIHWLKFLAYLLLGVGFVEMAIGGSWVFGGFWTCFTGLCFFAGVCAYEDKYPPKFWSGR